MNNTFRIALVLFFCLAAALPAGGKKEEKSANTQEEKTMAVQEEKGVPVQVSGRVRLVGNEPFRSLVITGQEKEWYIDREEEHILKNLQHKTVTVEGDEIVKEFTFPNGRLSGERRTLRNIKVIAVE